MTQRFQLTDRVQSISLEVQGLGGLIIKPSFQRTFWQADCDGEVATLADTLAVMWPVCWDVELGWLQSQGTRESPSPLSLSCAKGIAPLSVLHRCANVGLLCALLSCWQLFSLSEGLLMGLSSSFIVCLFCF